MNKWALGLLYALYGGGSYFAAFPESLVRAVCPDFSGLGIPCPTPKSNNGNIAARTITELDSTARLTVYSDNAGTIPSIIIGPDGVVHFPYGVNSKSMFSASLGAPLIGSDGKWQGPQAGSAGAGCTVTPGTNGAVQSCKGATPLVISNGAPGQQVRQCGVAAVGAGFRIDCPDAAVPSVSVAGATSGVSCRDSSDCVKALADKILFPSPGTATPGQGENLEVYPFLNKMVAPWATNLCEGRRYVRTSYFSQDPKGIPIPIENGCYDCQTRAGSNPSNCG